MENGFLGSNLLRYKNKQKYLVLDFETTSLSLLPENNRGWQLGTLRYEGKGLIESREDWLWWPDLLDYMSAGAAAVTRFDYETYKNRAKDPAPIMDYFEKDLYDKNTISVTANGWGFDNYLVNITRQLLNKKTDYSYCKNMVCIQNLHKAIELNIPIPKIGTNEWVLFNIKMYSFRKRGFKTNLKFLCGYYQISYDESQHHIRAEYDCELTMSVFLKQMWKVELEKIN